MKGTNLPVEVRFETAASVDVAEFIPLQEKPRHSEKLKGQQHQQKDAAGKEANMGNVIIFLIFSPP